MSKLTTPGGLGPRPGADSDVYTGMMLAAFLIVLGATIYVVYRTQFLFGGFLPPGGS